MFHFKRKAEVYVVYNGSQYKLDISEINFGQTFTEASYGGKSLQAPNMFWESSLYKARPATWDLRIPILAESDLSVVFNRLLDYENFDIFIKTGSGIFKIQNCVVTNGVFIITRTRPLQLELTGEGSRLTKVSSLEGTPITRSGTQTYAKINVLSVNLGGVSDFSGFTEFTMELQNDVFWVPYNTVDNSILAKGASTTIYPAKYVVRKRVLAGTMSRYATPELYTRNQNTTLTIEAGDLVNSNFFGIRVDLQDVSYTSRLNTGSIFTQSFDWRSTQNPRSLFEVIRQVRDLSNVGVGAILDSDSNPILDNNGEAILESI